MHHQQWYFTISNNALLATKLFKSFDCPALYWNVFKLHSRIENDSKWIKLPHKPFPQTIVSRGCLSSSFTADESITHSRHWVDSHHQCVQVRTCRHHPLLLGGRLSFGGKVTLSLGKKIGFPHFFSTFFILVIFLLSYLLLLCCLWNKYLCFWVPQKLYVNGRIKKHFLERKFEVKPPTKASILEKSERMPMMGKESRRRKIGSYTGYTY